MLITIIIIFINYNYDFNYFSIIINNIPNFVKSVTNEVMSMGVVVIYFLKFAVDKRDYKTEFYGILLYRNF